MRRAPRGTHTVGFVSDSSPAQRVIPLRFAPLLVAGFAVLELALLGWSARRTLGSRARRLG